MPDIIFKEMRGWHCESEVTDNGSRYVIYMTRDEVTCTVYLRTVTGEELPGEQFAETYSMAEAKRLCNLYEKLMSNTIEWAMRRLKTTLYICGVEVLKTLNIWAGLIKRK